MAPLVVDITDAAQPGVNALEIRVANMWRNRVIGDQEYPDQFPGADGPKEFETHVTTLGAYRPDDPLDRSGLMGPVQLYSAQTVTLK